MIQKRISLDFSPATDRCLSRTPLTGERDGEGGVFSHLSYLPNHDRRFKIGDLVSLHYLNIQERAKFYQEGCRMVLTYL